jgi:hypothetical protein
MLVIQQTFGDRRRIVTKGNTHYVKNIVLQGINHIHSRTRFPVNQDKKFALG